MDRIEKFIRKLGKKRALAIRSVVDQIEAGNLAGLDVKKLKGRDSEYRVRIGPVRVQFIRTDVGHIITDIDFKGDHTY